AYNNQYQKNLATYQNYLMTHPSAAQAMAGGTPYGSYYTGSPYYTTPSQALTSNPLMATLAPLLGTYPGLQNYAGAGTMMPVAQAPYMGSAYPVAPGAGYVNGTGFEPPCDRGGAGYGAYEGNGPYGYGAGAAYPHWHRRGYEGWNPGMAQFNRHAWMATHQ